MQLLAPDGARAQRVGSAYQACYCSDRCRNRALLDTVRRLAQALNVEPDQLMAQPPES